MKSKSVNIYKMSEKQTTELFAQQAIEIMLASFCNVYIRPFETVTTTAQNTFYSFGEYKSKLTDGRAPNKSLYHKSRDTVRQF